MSAGPLYLCGARLVLERETVADGAVLLEEGRIAAVCPGGAPPQAREVRLDGRLLLPGLVDLHCDAIEKEVEPRPGVRFPLAFACAQADRRNATAGITTAFHAISFAEGEFGVRSGAVAAELVRAVHALGRNALVDNRVHARYEITDETGLAHLLPLLRERRVHLVSFMDHTPGQGQFRDAAAYRGYLAGTYRARESDIDRLLEHKRRAAEGAARRIGELAAAARAQGVALASHDDDSPGKVEAAAALGATISEFPLDPQTARAARERGLATMFGAPNVLRGGSQSGAMRALDAVKECLADCLCSDYAPAALLAATLRLPEIAGIALHEAVALASAHPARAAGLADRGRIAPGLRADLVAVRMEGASAHVERLWRAGNPVLAISG